MCSLFLVKEEDLVEGLMENNHLLYATSEHTLKDCKNENVDSNDNVCVTDAQKEYIRQQSNERPASPTKSPRRVKNLPYKWSKGIVYRTDIEVRSFGLKRKGQQKIVLFKRYLKWMYSVYKQQSPTIKCNYRDKYCIYRF